MKTILKVTINSNEFLNAYKRYGKDSFICPVGYNSISDFVKTCKQSHNTDLYVGFAYDESMWFNVGDSIILNNIYYKVIGKIFDANKNTIDYELVYE